MPELLTRIYGTIYGLNGEPAGEMGTELTTVGDVVTEAPVWRGLIISVNIYPGREYSNKVITTKAFKVETDVYGGFEIYVLRGLVVKFTCSTFGKVVEIDTTGQTDVDISAYF